jgi:hypothetical protein
VNPTTGSVGHRRLVLDQSMIMAALDNVLNDRVMQGTSPAIRSRSLTVLERRTTLNHGAASASNGSRFGYSTNGGGTKGRL